MLQTQFFNSKTKHLQDNICAICLNNATDSAIVHLTEPSQHAVFCSLNCLQNFFSLTRTLKEEIKCPTCFSKIQIINKTKIASDKDLQKKQTLVTALILNKNFLEAEREITFLTEQFVSHPVKIDKIAPKAFARNDSNVIKYLISHMTKSNAQLSEWIFLAGLATESSPFYFVYQPIWDRCKEFSKKNPKDIENEIKQGLEKFNSWHQESSKPPKLNKTLQLLLQNFPNIESTFINSLTIQSAIESAQQTQTTEELIEFFKTNLKTLTLTDALTQIPLKILLFDKAAETMNYNLAQFLLGFGNFSTQELKLIKTNPFLKDSTDPIAFQILHDINSKMLRSAEISLLFCAALQGLSVLAYKYM